MDAGSKIAVDTPVSVARNNIRAMSGRRPRAAPSRQLLRVQQLIRQLEREGHPEWKDESGVPLRTVSQAELARRTGLDKSHISAMLNPETRGTRDIGASKLEALADGVGIDYGYFFDKFTGERSFMIYLLSAYKAGKKKDAQLAEAIGELRAEFDAKLEKFAAAQTEAAALRAENAELRAVADAKMRRAK